MRAVAEAENDAAVRAATAAYIKPSGEPAAWCFTDYFECLTVVDRKTLDAALLRIAQMPAWTLVVTPMF